METIPPSLELKLDYFRVYIWQKHSFSIITLNRNVLKDCFCHVIDIKIIQVYLGVRWYHLDNELARFKHASYFNKSSLTLFDHGMCKTLQVIRIIS